MLEIDIEFRKGIFFVRLNGILNNETKFKLNNEVTKTISLNGIKYLMLNVENLYYIDEEGIESLELIDKLINNNYGIIYISGLENNLVGKRIKSNKCLNKFKQVNSELDVLHLVNM